MALNKTFRVFVSSTFSDLIEERNMLQSIVLPKLQHLCHQYGCKFQFIDLRWGISEEAALNNKTMEICLDEITRCQYISPRPNFIILLGERYGWKPLPYQIPSDDFLKINAILNKASRETINKWYKEDRNAVPSVFDLQPRAGKYIDRLTWTKEEEIIHSILNSAIDELDIKDKNGINYIASATEQEIIKGALTDSLSKEHTFCFIRYIQDYSLDEKKAKGFVDKYDYINKLSQVKDRIKRKLLKQNVYEYETQWQDENLRQLYLNKLCEDVYNSLSSIIIKEIKSMDNIDIVHNEIDIHKQHSNELTQFFVGREQVLLEIKGYLMSISKCPLVISGISGSGKSSVLAMVYKLIMSKESNKSTIIRFGTLTPEASQLNHLINGICSEVIQYYNIREKFRVISIHKLTEYFLKCLSYASQDKPIIIFIDAFDQLIDMDHISSLNWLPVELPEHVKMIISIGNNSVSKVEKRIPKLNIIELTPMSTTEGKEMITNWLNSVSRTLQPNQFDAVMKAFENNGSPLYLRLLFEKVYHWKSYSSHKSFSENITGLMNEFLEYISDDMNHGEILVSKCLSLIAVSNDGLTENELTELLLTDQELYNNFLEKSYHIPPSNKLPMVLWSRLYFELKPYLSERYVNGSPLINFKYSQTKQCVEEKYIDEAKKQRYHEYLAGYFIKQPLWHSNNKPNIRKVMALPYQQLQAKLWLDLKYTLCDPLFIEAKCKAHLSMDLLADYNRVYSIKNILNRNPKDSIDRILAVGQAVSNTYDYIISEPSSCGAQLYYQMCKDNIPFKDDFLECVNTSYHKKHWLKYIGSKGKSYVSCYAQTAHNSQYIHYIRFSPDSQSLIFVDWTGKIGLWQYETTNISYAYCPSTGEFRNAGLLSDHKMFVNNSHEVWVYENEDNIFETDLEQGSWRCILRRDENTRITGSTACKIGGYGFISQVGKNGNYLYKLDANTGEIVAKGKLPTNNIDPIVNNIAYSSTGKLRAICYGDGELAISTGWVGMAHYGGNYHCEFINNDTQIASCGDDGTLGIWDLREGLIKRIHLIKGKADILAYCKVNNIIALGHRNGYVSLVRTDDTIEYIKGFNSGITNWVIGLAFSPCGKYLAIGGRGGMLKIYAIANLLDFEEEKTSQLSLSNAIKVDFIGNDQILYWDKIRRLFTSQPDISTRNFPISFTSYCHDKEHNIIVGAANSNLYIIDAVYGNPLYTIKVCNVKEEIISICIASNGNLMSILSSKHLYLYTYNNQWNYEKMIALNKELGEYRWNYYKFNDNLSMTFCNNNTVLALFIEEIPMATADVELNTYNYTSPDAKSYLCIIDIQKDQIIRNIQFNGFCTSLIYDEKENNLFLGKGKKNIYLKDNKIKEKLKYNYIISSIYEPAVYQYSTIDFSYIKKYTLHDIDEGVTDIRLLPDMKLIAVACDGGSLRIASLDDDKWLTSIHLAGCIRRIHYISGNNTLIIADDGLLTGGVPRQYEFRIELPNKE